MANQKTIDLIKSYASQGLKPSEIMAELKKKNLRASKTQVHYYVYNKKAKGEKSSGTKTSTGMKPAKGSSFDRALKVLETDVLTDSEKVAIAANILKAKPSA